MQYNVNAPVNVDGGTGFDKLVILGTEFADDFVLTNKGVFGAGLNVKFTTVEVVEVDGLEGDDQFFVLSTAYGVAYRVIGGLGSDLISVLGDISADIISRDLEGISGTVDHFVTSTDPFYVGLPVEGINYHLATPDAGVVVITETGTSTSVREGTTTGPITRIDSFNVQLSHAPGRRGLRDPVRGPLPAAGGRRHPDQPGTAAQRPRRHHLALRRHQPHLRGRAGLPAGQVGQRRAGRRERPGHRAHLRRRNDLERPDSRSSCGPTTTPGPRATAAW